MSSAICFNLDKYKILSSGNGFIKEANGIDLGSDYDLYSLVLIHAIGIGAFFLKPHRKQ